MRRSALRCWLLLFGELQDNVAAVSSNRFVFFGFAKDGMHVSGCSTQLVNTLQVLYCLHVFLVVVLRRSSNRLLRLLLLRLLLCFEHCMKLRAVRHNNDGILRRMASCMHLRILCSGKWLCKRHVGQSWFHDEVFVLRHFALTLHLLTSTHLAYLIQKSSEIKKVSLVSGRKCRDKKSVVLLHNALLLRMQCVAAVARFASAQLLSFFCADYVKQFNNACMQHCRIFRELL